jgi:hypothetical protein
MLEPSLDICYGLSFVDVFPAEGHGAIPTSSELQILDRDGIGGLSTGPVSTRHRHVTPRPCYTIFPLLFLGFSSHHATRFRWLS